MNIFHCLFYLNGGQRFEVKVIESDLDHLPLKIVQFAQMILKNPYHIIIVKDRFGLFSNYNTVEKAEDVLKWVEETLATKP